MLFKKECHNKKIVNSYFLNLCILTFILMYVKYTYQFDYGNEISASYPMAYKYIGYIYIWPFPCYNVLIRLFFRMVLRCTDRDGVRTIELTETILLSVDSFNRQLHAHHNNISVS